MGTHGLECACVRFVNTLHRSDRVVMAGGAEVWVEAWCWQNKQAANTSSWAEVGASKKENLLNIFVTSATSYNKDTLANAGTLLTYSLHVTSVQQTATSTNTQYRKVCFTEAYSASRLGATCLEMSDHCTCATQAAACMVAGGHTSHALQQSSAAIWQWRCHRPSEALKPHQGSKCAIFSPRLSVCQIRPRS